MAIVNDTTTVMKVPASLQSSGTVIVSEFGLTLTVDPSTGHVNVPSHLVSKYLDAGWSLVTADIQP